jgi:hypothetical protein
MRFVVTGIVRRRDGTVTRAEKAYGTPPPHRTGPFG